MDVSDDTPGFVARGVPAKEVAMSSRSIGFIGGGRVARILLGGLERAGASPATCVVSDADAMVLETLANRFSGIRATGADIAEPASQDVVFGALHPPAMKEALGEIGRHLRPDAVFVSLAPAIRLPALKSMLGGFDRLARMIPNAASIVGSGFNPIALSEGLGTDDKASLLEWLGVLGECPEVADEQLEAYAILTAMGPTYFWYQFEELERLGAGFGLDDQATRHALSCMLHGSVKTFFESNMRAEEIIDLIPVKPLESSESEVRDAYRTRLRTLHDKLTQR
jgi:pyrroline-5-carboxylate reductase